MLTFTSTKRKSFTLIEMLIVIVIIGILAAALVPRLQSMTERAQAIRAVTSSRNLYNGMKIKELDVAIGPTIIWEFDGDGKDKSGMGNDALYFNITNDKSLSTTPYHSSVSGNAMNAIANLRFPTPVINEFCVSMMMKLSAGKMGNIFRTDSILFYNTLYYGTDTFQINYIGAFTGMTSNVKRGRWHHILISHTGTGITAWVDGLKTDYISGTGLIPPDQTTNVNIYQYNQGTHGIDNVYYRNYACNEDVFGG